MEERFWSKVTITPGECWPWIGGVQTKGYGSFFHEGRGQLAHRIAYQLQVGPIPDGLTVDHLCWNRLCMNAEHMELITRSANSSRQRLAKRGGRRRRWAAA